MMLSSLGASEQRGRCERRRRRGAVRYRERSGVPVRQGRKEINWSFQPERSEHVWVSNICSRSLLPAPQIHRSKNKWKFHLKDGIMNLNGRDYVFSKAIGDAEWWGRSGGSSRSRKSVTPSVQLTEPAAPSKLCDQIPSTSCFRVCENSNPPKDPKVR